MKWSIIKENKIDKLAYHTEPADDDEYFIYFLSKKFDDTVLVSVAFDNINNINNVKYPDKIKKGDIIKVIDLFVLAVKGKKLPLEIKIDNTKDNKKFDGFDYKFKISQTFNNNYYKIGELFDFYDEYKNVSSYDIHLNDLINIIK